MIDRTGSMQTDQAEFLLRFLLPQLESEQAITKKILSAIPAGQDSYRPNEKARSAFGLAWHIAVVEMWFLDAVVQREFRETAAMPPDVKTSSDVAQWYARSVADRAPQLSDLSGEELVMPVNSSACGMIPPSPICISPSATLFTIEDSCPRIFDS